MIKPLLLSLLVSLTHASILLSCEERPTNSLSWGNSLYYLPHSKEIPSNCTVVHDNVAKLSNESQVAAWDTLGTEALDWTNLLSFFDDYRSIDDIYTWLATFVRQAQVLNPGVSITLSSLGTSLQGRDMPVIVITAMANKKFRRRRRSAIPQFYHQCGQHAREWASITTCLFALLSLAANFQNPLVHQASSSSPYYPLKLNVDVDTLLLGSELHIVPVVNPDGYQFTTTHQSVGVEGTSRLWRKNMRNFNPSTQLSGGFGVDLNRNWAWKWGDLSGASNDPFDETYMGPWAFSEPETLNVANYQACMTNKIGMIDYHTFGQLWMRPWGYTWTVSNLENQLKSMGDQVVQDMWRANDVNAAQYASTSAMDLYPVTGAADDYFSATSGVGITLELRDLGRYNFLLPNTYIRPVGREGTAAMVSFGLWGIQNRPPRLVPPLGETPLNPVCKTKVVVSTTTKITSSSTSKTTSTSSTTKTTSTSSTTKTTSASSTTKTTTRSTTKSTTKPTLKTSKTSSTKKSTKSSTKFATITRK